MILNEDLYPPAHKTVIKLRYVALRDSPTFMRVNILVVGSLRPVSSLDELLVQKKVLFTQLIELMFVYYFFDDSSNID